MVYEQSLIVSHFHLSVEVSRYTDGMLVALDDADWQKITPTTAKAIAGMLRIIARSIDSRIDGKAARTHPLQSPLKPWVMRLSPQRERHLQRGRQRP